MRTGAVPREALFDVLRLPAPLMAEVRDGGGAVVWRHTARDDVEFERSAEVVEAERRVAGGGSPEVVVVRSRKPDGSTGWVELRMFGVESGEDGHLVACSVQDVTEHRFAVEQMKLLLDRLPVVFTVTDLTGRVRVVTGSTLFSPQLNGEGERVDQLVPVGHPAREEVLRIFRTALGGRDADGRYLWNGRWTQGYAVPQRCGDQVVGVLGVAIDVHDLVTADHARYSAEARFRLFMDRSPATAAIRDENGDYTWLNEAARRAYQVPDSVHPPFAASAAFAPVVANAMDVMHARLKESGGAETRVWRIPLAQGEVHIFGHRFAFTDAEGRYLEGNIGLDLTERVLADRELVRWRDRYQALFDRAPIPMLVLSETGIVLDANPALCEIFSARLSELRGQAVADFHETDDTPDAEEQIAALLSGNRRAVAFARRYRTRDGRVVHAAVTCVLVPGEEDGSSSVVAILRPRRTASEEIRPILLTDNEIVVLEIKALGLSNEETAGRLGITRRGVDYQLRSLARKLRCANNSSLMIATAYHLGVLDQQRWPPRVRSRFRAAAGGALDGRTPVQPPASVLARHLTGTPPPVPDR
ncbi:PAS domain S-box protein [Lentzea albida]|uniref:PAS domain S-box-containing protein n=1 Tax=Lentzea albida TaxID=65499 RepID=A0A1H9WUP4_9PSEU|nr:PAS domain S-box protein [Lentzea albida]SES37123.1 PAS domain S-box-containing protein [Lentzea albida]